MGDERTEVAKLETKVMLRRLVFATDTILAKMFLVFSVSGMLSVIVVVIMMFVIVMFVVVMFIVTVFSVVLVMLLRSGSMGRLTPSVGSPLTPVDRDARWLSTGGGGRINCGRRSRRRGRSGGRNSRGSGGGGGWSRSRNSGRWNRGCCGISSGSINNKRRRRAQGYDGDERRGADPVVAVRQLTGNISDIQLRNSEGVRTLSDAILAVVVLESVERHGNCNGMIERIKALTNPRNVLEKAIDTGEIAH